VSGQGGTLQNEGWIDRECSAFLHSGRQAFHRSVSPGRSLPPHVSILIAHLKSSLGGARPKRPHWLTAYASWWYPVARPQDTINKSGHSIACMRGAVTGCKQCHGAISYLCSWWEKKAALFSIQVLLSLLLMITICLNTIDVVPASTT
jgi:hypothetical protein